MLKRITVVYAVEQLTVKSILSAKRGDPIVFDRTAWNTLPTPVKNATKKHAHKRGVVIVVGEIVHTSEKPEACGCGEDGCDDCDGI